MNKNINISPQELSIQYHSRGIVNKKFLVGEKLYLEGLLANCTLLTVEPKPLKDMRYMSAQAMILNLDNVISIYYQLIPFAYAFNVNYGLEVSNDDIDRFLNEWVDISEAIDFAAFYSRNTTPDDD